MSDFFYGIQHITEEYLFVFHDFLRGMDSWWGANFINWAFMIIGSIAFVYWMGQLKQFNDNKEENKDITAHSYL